MIGMSRVILAPALRAATAGYNGVAGELSQPPRWPIDQTAKASSAVEGTASHHHRFCGKCFFPRAVGTSFRALVGLLTRIARIIEAWSDGGTSTFGCDRLRANSSTLVVPVDRGDGRIAAREVAADERPRIFTFASHDFMFLGS